MLWADLKEYVALNEEYLDDMWKAQSAKKTVADVSGSWQISPKYTGYTLADPIVVRNNATLAYKEIVIVRSLSYLSLPDYGDTHQATTPAEGIAPTPAPTAPEPATEP